MRIIKCDKCGKEITEDREHVYGVYKDNGSSEAELLDLCDKHYQDLVDWITLESSPVDDNPVPDEPMSVRQILEKFENWYVEYSKCYGSSMDFARYRLMANGTYAIDKYLKEEGIEE